MKAGYKTNTKKSGLLKAYAGDIQKMPPNLSLDEEDLPEIKKWKVGGKYRILLDVEQVSMSKDHLDNNEIRASFNIIKAQPYTEKESDG